MRSLQSIFAVLALAAVLVAATGCDNYRTARHRLVGWQAYNDADYAAAYDRFAQAVDLDSTDWVSQYYLGVLELDWRKNPAEARRRLEIAETLRDAHPNAQYGGEVGQEHGVVDRPTRAMVTEKLAQALLAQGYNRQLASYLRETADNFGETDDYLRLARYLHKVGDPDAAKSAYAQAIKIADRTDPEPYFQLAEFYDAIGDREAALTRYRQVYFLDPDRKGLADTLRAHGIVPGPTIALPPDDR